MANEKELYKNHTLTTPEFVALLYNQYGKKLYGYAIKNWSVSEDQAWDLVYKTLYKTIETYKSYVFENEEKFGAFIFKIFINYLRNHYRDSKKQAERLQVTTEISSHELYNHTGTNATEQSTDPKLAVLREELEKMEDWQRMLLLMRSEGRPYSEIATYVQKPEEQLKVYYQRLKESITKKIYERL